MTLQLGQVCAPLSFTATALLHTLRMLAPHTHVSLMGQLLLRNEHHLGSGQSVARVGRSVWRRLTLRRLTMCRDVAVGWGSDGLSSIQRHELLGHLA